MEDLLPVYASVVHKYCPCNEVTFRQSALNDLSYAIFHIREFSQLSDNNKKTIRNHLTEIVGVLLGLYYPEVDQQTDERIIHESESCRFLVEHSDFPTFFKNLCLNYQFPNGEKKATVVGSEMKLGIKVKPFCFLVSLLYIAQEHKVLLSKQEIGYYALNNLDVLRGIASPEEVFTHIVHDRLAGIKRNKLSGSSEWQHIKEQFNLLELANIVNHDSQYIWLNSQEGGAISLFRESLNGPFFNVYDYDMADIKSRKTMIDDWKKYNSKLNSNLLTISTPADIRIADHNNSSSHKPAVKSSTALGDEGEAFVYKMEKERVRKYRERLANKVLLLGKTKGLGYDIASIEADESPTNPEFARYIEVKTTKRVTRPTFNAAWTDTVNITRKEWVAAEQLGKAYNIYRVYFTKHEIIVIRINNPFALAADGRIEVVPTVYQMDFASNVIDIIHTSDNA